MPASTKFVTLALCALCQVVPLQSSPIDDPDVGLNTVQMIENHGYPWENHVFTTKDGYILTYHRIPHGLNNARSINKSVVLLMHALSFSSADFVEMGPDRGLGYLLADQGYDVWIGNARGNAWCRNHTTLDPVKDEKEFYDFSWHEVGYYDLPVAIDYILGVTKAQNIFYVGYSMGSTAFLVLTTTRPEYNSKIRLASLMGPASFMDHNSNPVARTLATFIAPLQILADLLQVYEVPLTKQLQTLGTTLCWRREFSPICQALIFSLAGGDPVQFNQGKVAVFFTNTPSNAAVKQWAHYGQLIKNGGFTQYDHGRSKNMKIYGSEKPPAYNISKISAPVAVYYGMNDGLVNYRDAQKVISLLPNLVHQYLVPYRLFSHADFILAKDVVKLLYTEMFNVMKKYQITP